MRCEFELRHVTKQGAVYLYERRVPKRFAAVVKGRRVRQSLRTRDPKIAAIKAAELDQTYEARWEALLAGRDPDAAVAFEAALRLAQQAGFRYREAEDLIGDPAELVRRVLSFPPEPTKAEADGLLGTAPRPPFLLSEALDFYFEQTEHERLGKSPTQLRIIINGRRKVMAGLIDTIGDGDMATLTRDDLMAYREALRQRVVAGALAADSANKDLGQLRVVLRTVFQLKGLSAPDMQGLALKVPKKRQGEHREVLPFTNDWVQNRLLVPGVLDGLNAEARRVIYAMVETGLRPSEVVNILPENICLDDEVPHVRVTITEARDVKTMSSERRIPLVGVSLRAFQEQAQGFPNYFDRNPQLSATVGKYLKSAGLLPTARHRLYSLRHAFEDRLIAAGMDYRVRKELMGHQVSDMTYGVGASLAQIRETLAAMAFKSPPDV